MIVAVVIAARAAGRFIEECLRSVKAQALPDGWVMDVRLGVDDCNDSYPSPHWRSAGNVGPYVMRNSLMALRQADAYAPFDADDVMLPGYIARLVGIAGVDGIAGSARTDIKEEGAPNGKVHKFVHGICLFSAAAMMKLGGYRAWPVVADLDIVMRAKALKIPVRNTREVLYLRRRHGGSLTNSPELGMYSPTRTRLTMEARRLTANGDLYVEPVTTKLSCH